MFIKDLIKRIKSEEDFNQDQLVEVGLAFNKKIKENIISKGYSYSNNLSITLI